MNENTRKKLEMGKRALEFCRAHPDSNPQWLAAVARLETRLARAAELEGELELEEMRQRKNDPTEPAA